MLREFIASTLANELVVESHARVIKKRNELRASLAALFARFRDKRFFRSVVERDTDGLARAFSGSLVGEEYEDVRFVFLPEDKMRSYLTREGEMMRGSDGKLEFLLSIAHAIHYSPWDPNPRDIREYDERVRRYLTGRALSDRGFVRDLAHEMGHYMDAREIDARALERMRAGGPDEKLASYPFAERRPALSQELAQAVDPYVGVRREEFLSAFPSPASLAERVFETFFRARGYDEGYFPDSDWRDDAWESPEARRIVARASKLWHEFAEGEFESERQLGVELPRQKRQRS